MKRCYRIPNGLPGPSPKKHGTKRPGPIRPDGNLVSCRAVPPCLSGGPGTALRAFFRARPALQPSRHYSPAGLSGPAEPPLPQRWRRPVPASLTRRGGIPTSVAAKIPREASLPGVVASLLRRWCSGERRPGGPDAVASLLRPAGRRPSGPSTVASLLLPAGRSPGGPGAVASLLRTAGRRLVLRRGGVREPGRGGAGR
jgi:hypothetical protein